MEDWKRRKLRLEKQSQNKTQTFLLILMIKSLIILMLTTRIRAKTTRSFSGGLMGSLTLVTQQKLQEISGNYRLINRKIQRLVDDKDTTNLCLAVERDLRTLAGLR